MVFLGVISLLNNSRRWAERGAVRASDEGVRRIILDQDQVLVGVSRRFTRLPRESIPAWLLRLTHLHSQAQGITKIADLSSCCNITVLYLYSNQLTNIDALHTAPHIELLYLQGNMICKISGLDKLTCLRKLYLTGNRIARMEGLENNMKLEEVHIDRQLALSGRLALGRGLSIDPRSCVVLAHSLSILNLSYTPVEDVEGRVQTAELNFYIALKDICLFSRPPPPLLPLPPPASRVSPLLLLPPLPLLTPTSSQSSF